MLHFIAGFLAGCPVWIPTGAYLFYRYGSALKADVQAVEAEVTKIVGKGKASEK